MESGSKGRCRRKLYRMGLLFLLGMIFIKPQEISAEEARAPASNSEITTIKVIARQYQFEPSRIHISVGRPVRFEVQSIDTTHGFGIKSLGINRVLKKGKTELIDFVPSQTGQFEIACSVFCGFGHRRMKGLLIVEEETS